MALLTMQKLQVCKTVTECQYIYIYHHQNIFCRIFVLYNAVSDPFGTGIYTVATNGLYTVYTVITQCIFTPRENMSGVDVMRSISVEKCLRISRIIS